jgi:hypothetical protein
MDIGFMVMTDKGFELVLNDEPEKDNEEERAAFWKEQGEMLGILS